MAVVSALAGGGGRRAKRRRCRRKARKAKRERGGREGKREREGEERKEGEERLDYTILSCVSIGAQVKRGSGAEICVRIQRRKESDRAADAIRLKERERERETGWKKTQPASTTLLLCSLSLSLSPKRADLNRALNNTEFSLSFRPHGGRWAANGATREEKECSRSTFVTLFFLISSLSLRLCGDRTRDKGAGCFRSCHCLGDKG